jgi:cell volume regulation protein A
MRTTDFFTLLGGVLVLGFLANRLYRLTRIPNPVVLILTGLLIGPVLGWVDGSRLHPAVDILGELALILVLFEGGLELNIKETFRHFAGGVVLAIIGFAVSVLFIAPVVFHAFGVGWLPSLVIASLFACTSSTIVVPVLKQISANETCRVILMLESALADVLAIITTGVLISLQEQQGAVVGSLLGGFISRLVISIVIAALAGAVWARLLPHLVEERFWHVLTFGVVLLIFSGTSAIGGTGLLAVLGFGMTLANLAPILRPEHEAPLERDPSQLTLDFHAEVGFLTRTFFFVLLGVVVKVVSLWMILPTLGILGAIAIARWVALRASRWSFRGVTPADEHLMYWMMPRGLVTAVLAIQVISAYGEDFRFLSPIAFAVILATNLMVVVGARGAPVHPSAATEQGVRAAPD